MASISKQSFNQPDQTQTPEKITIETVSLDGTTVQRITAEPGWRWSKHIQPIAGGTSCQKDHFLYVISGNMHAKMDDGQEMEFGAGDVGFIPPGHDGWNEGSEPVIWIELPH